MGDSRCFENTIEIGPALNNEEVTRQILKAASAALKEVKAAALGHAGVSGGGVYVGLAGAALTYLRMAAQLRRGFRYAHGSYLQKHDEARCLDTAGRLLDEADRLMSSRRVTFLEGASGVLACRALLAHMQGQHADAQAHAQAVVGLWEGRIRGVLPDPECELLYGRAGYLYCLSWLQQGLGRDAVPHALVKAVVRHLLDEGLRGAAALDAEAHVLQAGGSSGGSGGGGGGSSGGSSCGGWRLMWSWHGKRYLGAAHGVAGILYVLLHHIVVVRELDAEQQQQQQQGRYMPALLATLDALAASQLPSGNLPTKLGDREDVRVAWCHGAAGLVLTLLKAAEVLGGGSAAATAATAAAAAATGGGGGGAARCEAYVRGAVLAGDDVWQRGLLRKGVGLCHGISGNGYALLALARHMADGDGGPCAGAGAAGGAATAADAASAARRQRRQHHYLRAARGFALYAAQHWRELYDVPDRPTSLFEGLAGAVNFWLDVVDPQHSRWPGAEL